MVLYRYGSDPWADPLTALRRIQDEVNRTFGASRWQEPAEFPPLNVWRGEEGLVVAAEVPGFALEHLEITVHQNTLTIKGKREPEVAEPEVTYHRRERQHGAFARTLTLPFNADPDSVTASAHNGILLITVPRPESDKPKRIEIKVG